ncbi:MAG: hypothetical protein DRI79_10280, partial [Chloroflexi bacterium]
MPREFDQGNYHYGASARRLAGTGWAGTGSVVMVPLVKFTRQIITASLSWFQNDLDGLPPIEHLQR